MPKLCAAWRIAFDADQQFSPSAIVEENSVFCLNRRFEPTLERRRLPAVPLRGSQLSPPSINDL
jgi:hypothetical protein